MVLLLLLLLFFLFFSRRPGRPGRICWVRLSAWIWDFSSTLTAPGKPKNLQEILRKASLAPRIGLAFSICGSVDVGAGDGHCGFSGGDGCPGRPFRVEYAQRWWLLSRRRRSSSAIRGRRAGCTWTPRTDPSVASAPDKTNLSKTGISLGRLEARSLSVCLDPRRVH